MNLELVKRIADAVIHEGYLLYPYRPSALKNRHRWNWGIVYPLDYGRAREGADPWCTQTECLIVGGEQTDCTVRVRFFRLVPGAGKDWQDAEQEEVILYGIGLRRPVEARLNLPGASPISGFVEAGVEAVSDGLLRLRVRIVNLTPVADAASCSREQVLRHSLLSTHAILQTHNGEFVSLLDPPECLAEEAARCNNIGIYPVLVGEPGQRDAVLSSPIILYDYPEVAPESPGELFDSTEIDELLTLRILTLSDGEKKELRASGPRVRELLERTESMPQEQFLKLHGAIRDLRRVNGAAR